MPYKNKEDNKSYQKEYQKKWSKLNPDKRKMYSKKYYDNNTDSMRDYSKEYYKENKEEVNKKCRDKYHENPEIEKERCKKKYYKNTDLSRERGRMKYYEYRNDLLNMYGNICACCGESNNDILTLDHINNDGHKYIVEGQNRGSRTSSERKRALKEYKPDEFQILCANCNNSKKRNNGVCWHINKEDNRSKETLRIWERVYDIYGSSCIMCGESNPTALQVDHIRDDGKGEKNILYKIVKNIDLSMYQILCANCNLKKEKRRLRFKQLGLIDSGEEMDVNNLS